jgi:SnoaL-like domain
MATLIDQYLVALTGKDWAGLASTLAPVFERVGPFRDVIGSRDEYVQFLDRVVTPLEDYNVRPVRVVPSDDVVFAEVVESFVYGEKMEVPEVLVFDLGPDGLISRVQVYMMHVGQEPPVPGARA